ncbi:MAG TPA: hypothetical protein VM782_18145 [Stellaceae bacterium]|nr:hypothetical protein [Stellaceae bacterium]
MVAQLAPPGCLQQGTSGGWLPVAGCLVLAVLSVNAAAAAMAWPGICVTRERRER